MRKSVLVLLCAAAPSAAFAQEMPLSEYLSRTDALMKKVHNQASPEYMALRDEINGALVRAQNERRIARKEGRAPTACLPAGRPATSNAEVAKHFASIPAEERQNLSVGKAFMQLMERKFPCASASR